MFGIQCDQIWLFSKGHDDKFGYKNASKFDNALVFFDTESLLNYQLLWLLFWPLFENLTYF